MQPKRCVKCKGTDLRQERGPDTYGLRLADGTMLEYLFDDVPQIVCQTCGERYFAGNLVDALERAVTQELVRRPIRDPAVFRWLRKGIELTAAELADLLGVTAETISHWENGHSEPDRATWATLDQLVEDDLFSRTTTRDRLRALAERRVPRRRVHLSLHVATAT